MKSFSIETYGEEGARALAIRERQKHREQIEGYLVHSEAAFQPESGSKKSAQPTKA